MAQVLPSAAVYVVSGYGQEVIFVPGAGVVVLGVVAVAVGAVVVVLVEVGQAEPAL